MDQANKSKKFLKDHPYLSQLAVSFGCGLMASCLLAIVRSSSTFSFSGILVSSFILACFFVYPFVLTCYQAWLLFKVINSKESIKQAVWYDAWTLALAMFYEILYLSVGKDVVFSADWQIQLRNAQVHAPIYTGSYVAIALLSVICLAGILLLWLKSVNELPPLITVFCISSAYLGVLLMIVWTVQIFKFQTMPDLFLLLPPGVMILIVAKTIVIKIREFEPDPNRMSKINKIPILNKLNTFLANAKRWPLMGLVLMLPLLALMMLILILCGQSPDSLIRAFTETSDWNLSQKVSPQNIVYDEHYLCTVAAGGHPEIVRPKRKGIRHGHQVTVNRQLMIANAFEQILEERLPETHRIIRGIYDRYGFPLARLIKAKWVADLIWIMMKPLEWFFLIIIYLCDQHPEDRIAIQYTGKQVKDFC